MRHIQESISWWYNLQHMYESRHTNTCRRVHFFFVTLLTPLLPHDKSAGERNDQPTPPSPPPVHTPSILMSLVGSAHSHTASTLSNRFKPSNSAGTIHILTLPMMELRYFVEKNTALNASGEIEHSGHIPPDLMVSLYHLYHQTNHP